MYLPFFFLFFILFATLAFRESGIRAPQFYSDDSGNYSTDDSNIKKLQISFWFVQGWPLVVDFEFMGLSTRKKHATDQKLP